jgi:hypothetical protein
MIAQAAQDAGMFGDGGVGTVLLIVGMVVALAVVSGLGFIARMNDRSKERKAAQAGAVEPADRAAGDA